MEFGSGDDEAASYVAEEVLGEKVYRRLVDVPFDIDVVDVFRRAEFLGEVVDDAIAKGVTVGIWGQFGVVNQEAAAKARAGGLARGHQCHLARSPRGCPGRAP